MMTEIAELAVYLFRRVKRNERLSNAARWTSTTGTIVHAKPHSGVVDILYTYQFEGSYFSNAEKRDFFWSQSATDYATRLSDQGSLAIRVNPTAPGESVIFDEDKVEAPGIVLKE